jgi:hypothetical protein
MCTYSPSLIFRIEKIKGVERTWNILGKSARESLLAGDLLASDERLNGYCDGAVDVLAGAVL